MENLLICLLIGVGGVGVFFLIKISIKNFKEGYNSVDVKEAVFKDFVEKMINRGFTKRIVASDFLANFYNLKEYNLYTEWYFVGIWLNYPKRLVSLRTDYNTWNEVDIPFDKIKNIEVIEDGYSETTGHVIGGVVAIGSAKSKEFSQGLKIRIVTGDMTTGTHSYFLKLFDPKNGGKYDKSSVIYKNLQECARSIVDEIENIIHNT